MARATVAIQADHPVASICGQAAVELGVREEDERRNERHLRSTNACWRASSDFSRFALRLARCKGCPG